VFIERHTGQPGGRALDDEAFRGQRAFLVGLVLSLVTVFANVLNEPPTRLQGTCPPLKPFSSSVRDLFQKKIDIK
jgi:hypothetical protein